MMAPLKCLPRIVLPAWVKWVACAALCASTYLAGRLQEARRGADAMSDYVAAQLARTVAIASAQTKVVVQTEIKYRDRIREVYVKGDVIEKQIPVYVTEADNAECRINAGFVRTYNAAWSGEPAGSPSSTDRDAAGFSLAEVAEVDAYNATSCRAWRELALGLREFYIEQKTVLK